MIPHEERAAEVMLPEWGHACDYHAKICIESRKQITAAITAVVADEREACAKVASKCGLAGLRVAAAIRPVILGLFIGALVMGLMWITCSWAERKWGKK